MPDNKIPNSGDLIQIANAMKTLASNINAVAPAISELAKAMSAIKKINVNDIVEGSANMSAVAASAASISRSVQQFGQALTQMSGAIKPADLNTISLIPIAINRVLSTFIVAGDRRNMKKAQRGMDFLVGKDVHSGLISMMLKMNDDISKSKFDPTAYENLVKIFSTLGKSLKSICISLSVAALLGIPAYVGAMLMFGVGSVPGVLTLVVVGMVRLQEYMNAIKGGQQIIKDISIAIGLLAATLGVLVLVGIFATKYWKEVLVSMGFMLVLVGIFALLALTTRLVKDGTQNILRMAEALAIIALMASMLMLLGQFVKTNWETFLTVGAYMGILLMVFLTLAFSSKWIKEGAKYMLYIAASIATLALTAVLLILVGDYLDANWASLLIVGTYMVVLTGIFLALAFGSKWIKEGAKQMLYIAATVAILAPTAVLLILVGEYLDTNWESVLAVSLMLGVLMSMVFVVSKAAKRIQKAKAGMVMLMIFTVLMVGAVWALAEIAEGADIEKTLWATGIMLGIVVGIGVIAVVAGKLEKHIRKGEIAMGIIVGIATIMISVMIGLATASQIADPLEILAVTGIMALIIVAVGALAIAAGALLAGPQAILFALGLAALTTITIICGAIAGVALILAVVAKAVEATGFDNAKDLARVLNLPFAALMEEDDTGSSLLDKIWDLPNPIKMAGMLTKVTELAGIVCSVGLIANILQHIASLNMPDPEKGYDKDGNPLGWKQMTGKDFSDAAVNAAGILGVTSAMFGDDHAEYIFADGTHAKVDPISKEGLRNIGLLTAWKVKQLAKIVSSVGDMASVLQNIASLNIPISWSKDGSPNEFRQMNATDFAMASENAGSILTYFATLFADEKVQIKVCGQTVNIAVQSKWMAGLNNIHRSTRRKVERLGEIVGYVGGMADTIQKVASLNIPVLWDKEGKPVLFHKMNKTDFTKASENVGVIATTLAGAISDPGLAARLEEMDSDAAENFKTIMEPMGMIRNVMDVIQMLGEDRYVKTWKTGPNGEQIPDEEGKFSEILNNAGNIQDKITKMVDIIVGGFSLYNSGDKEDMVHDAEDEIESIAAVATQGCDVIKLLTETYNSDLKTLDINDYSEKWNNQMTIMARMMHTMGGGGVDEAKARALAKNIDNTVKLIRQINGVNVDKLKYAEGIMRSLATVSTQIKGNFDGLARTINEKLIKALEKLEKALKQVAENEFGEGGVGGANAPDPVPNPNGGGSKRYDPENKQSGTPGKRKDDYEKTQVKTQQDLFDAVDDIRDFLLFEKKSNYNK